MKLPRLRSPRKCCSRRPPLRWLVALFAAWGVSYCLQPSIAFAQTDAERAAARAAAGQGIEAYEAGDWAKAVEYFSKAQGLLEAPTHLLYIARAEEKQGHLVQAREAYIKINRLSLDEGAPQAFLDAKQSAEQELPGVEARLPYATIYVDGGQATGIEIDGEDFSQDIVGVPIPINPGSHTFEAVGDGMVSDAVTRNVAEAAKVDVKLVLAQASPAPVTEPSTDGAAGAGLTATSDGMNDQGSPKQTLRIGAYASFGVAVVGLVGGTIFLLKRSSKESDADDSYARFEQDDCLNTPSSACRSLAGKIQGLDDDAASAGTLATVGYAVGIAAAGAGVVLFVLSQDDGAAGTASQQPSLVPYASWNGAGVVGRF